MARTNIKGRAQLTKGTQIKIYEMRAKNPDLSLKTIAEHFHASYNQVRYAIKAVGSGKKHRSTTRTRSAKALVIKEKSNTTDLINSQIHFSLAQMEANEKLEPNIRAVMLGTLARAIKQTTETEMQVHLKGMDWATFTFAIRMFNPAATDKDIIKIFNEAKELCRINSVD